MKTLIATASLAFLAATALAADPSFGVWASPKNESGASLHVQVGSCGETICGKILKVIGSDNQSAVGKAMVWNMQPKGGGVYRGKIWAPDTDRTYNGKMTLNGNSLKMEGCILGICRGENFARLK